MRLIKNGDVNWDMVHTKNELTDMAFKKLETIEDLMDAYNIKDVEELKKILEDYDRRKQ